MMVNGKWYSETETASLIETLQKENEALKSKLNSSNESLKTAIEDLKKYLKLAVEDLSSEAGISFEYEDEVEKLIGGIENG